MNEVERVDLVPDKVAVDPNKDIIERDDSGWPTKNFHRRFRFEVIQVVQLDVDLMAEERDVAMIMGQKLLDAYVKDPTGWQRQFERMFPSMERGGYRLGSVYDIGPVKGGYDDPMALEAGS